MKKILFAFFITTFVFATNGSHLIGISAVSNGLGGTAVGHYTSNTDAIYRNPSLLTVQKTNEGKDTGLNLELWTTVFKPNSTVTSSPSATKTSDNSAVILPNFAVGYKGEDIGVGLAFISYGGARADYLGQLELSQIQASSSSAKASLGFAYRPLPDFSIGVSPYLGYSDLAINSAVALPPVSETVRMDNKPHGATALGAAFGATLHSLEPLTIAAAFSTKSTFTYKSVADLNKFNLAADGVQESIDVSEPMQFAVGASYAANGVTFAADYRRIFWSKASGYQELGWTDQGVIALGAEYKLNDVALRAGYNYGKSPIPENTAEVGTATTTISNVPTTAQTISLMNAAAFPGITESHLTLGLGYASSESFSIDAAFVYAFGKTLVRSGTGALGSYSYTGEISQWGVSLGGILRM